MASCRVAQPSGVEFHLVPKSEYIIRGPALRQPLLLQSKRGHRARFGQNVQPKLLQIWQHEDQTQENSLIPCQNTSEVQSLPHTVRDASTSVRDDIVPIIREGEL